MVLGTLGRQVGGLAWCWALWGGRWVGVVLGTLGRQVG